MTMPARTCTQRIRATAESCGGEIRPSYIATDAIVGARGQKTDVTHPAACAACGKTYVDMVSIAMTQDDLAMVGDRMSPSSRQELQVTATKLASGGFDVELTEDRARDFASKAANLGLGEFAHKIRQELATLTAQRARV